MNSQQREEIVAKLKRGEDLSAKEIELIEHDTNDGDVLGQKEKS